MQEFEWTDSRDDRRWKVRVGRKGNGVTAMPRAGHVWITFQGAGDEVMLQSPVRPEACDVGILQDLLDWGLGRVQEAG